MIGLCSDAKATFVFDAFKHQIKRDDKKYFIDDLPIYIETQLLHQGGTASITDANNKIIRAILFMSVPDVATICRDGVNPTQISASVDAVIDGEKGKFSTSMTIDETENISGILSLSYNNGIVEIFYI